jgi:ATP-dependent exoDNAse (exonuclease V) alpha subunit
LREVDGIGPVRAAGIVAAWAEEKVVREIVVFLHSHGVGTAGADRAARRPDARTESHRAAVGIALASKVLVITGGPGVGKTTIVTAILRILSAKDVRLLLSAPTGRAEVHERATGFEAKIIHRLLEVAPRGGGFRPDNENPLDCDVLIVDETSMVMCC